MEQERKQQGLGDIIGYEHQVCTNCTIHKSSPPVTNQALRLGPPCDASTKIWDAICYLQKQPGALLEVSC